MVQAADLQGIFRIIQSIPSKKAEPVKQWLAQLGEQRIDQIIDPELTFQMAVEDYRRQGYSGIKDAVTDGKGMGVGLYSTFLLARNAGLRFEVRSGTYTMQAKDELKHITKSDFWQGTIIYLQLYTNKEINPAEVVANRTNVAEQYNELFLNDNELEELW